MSVGGINISIGADASRAQAGIDTLKKELADLKGTLGGLRLEGAIKGDPFSTVKQSFVLMRKSLDETFNKWRTDLGLVSKSNSDMVAKTEARLKSLANSYKYTAKQILQSQKTLNTAQATTLSSTPFIGQTKKQLGQVLKPGEGAPQVGTRTELMNTASIAELKTVLATYKKIFPEMSQTITDFQKRLKSQTKVSRDDVVNELMVLQKAV